MTGRPQNGDTPPVRVGCVRTGEFEGVPTSCLLLFRMFVVSYKERVESYKQETDICK